MPKTAFDRTISRISRADAPRKRTRLLTAAALILAVSCGGGGDGRRADRTGDAIDKVGQGITGTPPSVTPLPPLTGALAGVVPGGGQVAPSGAYTYTVPIAVPRGRAGLQPRLALSYSSQAGVGHLGRGWAISGLSMITRCKKVFSTGATGATNGSFKRPTETILFNSSDEYCLNGQKLLLVPNTGNYGAQGSEYRTEVDTFQKIVLTTVGPTGPDVWTVHRKDGIIATYRPNMHPFRDTLTTTGELDTRNHTSFAFTVENERDRAGNEIDYDWGFETVPRIIEIRYSECAAQDSCSPYPSNALRKVTFEYDTDPNPPPGQYVNGVYFGSTFRLTHIKTWDLTRAGAADLVRDYRLHYLESALTRANLLDRITIADAAGNTLPPTFFRYNGENMDSGIEYEFLGTDYVDPLVLRPNVNDGTRTARETMLESSFAVLDANGDGNDDIVLKRWAGAVDGFIIGPNQRATSNVEPRDLLLLGDGDQRFHPPVPLDPEGNGQPAAGATCQQAEIIDLQYAMPVDLGADGKQELVAAMSEHCPFNVATSCLGAPGACDFRVTTRFNHVNNFPDTGRKFGVLKWDPALGTLTKQPLGEVESVSWLLNRLMFADTNGDSVPELFRTRLPNFTTWQELRGDAVSSGDAVYHEASDTFMTTGGTLTSEVKPEDSVSVQDEDGDGRQELVGHAAGIYRAYSRNPNRVGEWRIVNEVTGAEATRTGFDPGAVWTQMLTPNAPDAPNRVYVDLNGDGLKDILLPVIASGEFVLRYNTGAGYTPAVRLSADQAVIDALRPYAVAGGPIVKSGLIPVDWNGDGREDLLLLGTAANSTPILMPNGTAHSGTYVRTDPIQVLYGTNTGFRPPQALPTNNEQRILSTILGWTSIKVAELDGNSLPELIIFVRDGTTGSRRRLKILGRKNRYTGVDTLFRVDDARGVTAEHVLYDSLSDGSFERRETLETHTSDTFGTEFEPGTNPPVALHLPCRYPAKCVSRGTVVARYDNRRTPRRIFQHFRYFGARMDVTGRGSLGYRKITVTDGDTGAITETRFSPVISHGSDEPTQADYHAYLRLTQPVSVKHKLPFGHLVPSGMTSVTDAPLATKIEYSPVFSQARPFVMTRSLTKLRLLEEVGHLGQPPPLAEERERARKETDVNYDGFGNETSRINSTFDVSLNATAETLLERITRTTTYRNVLASWLISLPDRVTTRHETRAAPYDGCTTFPCDVETRVVDHVFDAEGLLKDVIREPAGDASTKLTVSLGRDAAGLVRSITVKDSTGSSATTQRVTEVDYDAFGHHPRVTKNAEGHLNWFLYDQRLDTLQVETDANGVSVYAQYDQLGRLRETRDDRGPARKLSYGVGFVREEEVDGAKQTHFFDARNRPEVTVWSTMAGSGVSQNTYDVVGNLIETRYVGTTEPYATVSATDTAAKQRITSGTSFVTYSAIHDGRSRPVQVRHGSDLPVVTTYKGLGETWVDHGSGTSAHQRKLFRSATGRVREVQDKLVVGSTAARWLPTKYEYDTLGLLAKVTDPRNQIDRFYYDRLGRRTFRASTAWKSQLTVWNHSAFGDLTAFKDGVNDLTFTYDRLGRRDRTLTASGTVLADLTWDQGGAWGIGKLSRAVGPTGHDISYNYDPKGRPYLETHRLGQAELATLRTYDARGRLDVLYYPEFLSTDKPLGPRGAGLAVKYFYSNGQTSQIQNVTTSTPVTLWTVNERHPMGMLQKITTQFDDVASWVYKNDTLRLERISGAGFFSFPGVFLQYGPTGMLQSRTLQTLTETFDHDTLRRLWRYQRISSSGSLRLAGVEYSYDDAGNMTRADATQAHESTDWSLTDYDYVYGNGAFPQRLTQLRSSAGVTRELRYDQAGRQIEDQPTLQSPAFRKITYNHEDLPIRIERMLNATTPDTSQSPTTFDYDAFGSRAKKTRGQETVLYLGELYRRTPTLTFYTIATEDGPVMELRQSPGGTATTPNYLFHDHVGSRVIQVLAIAGLPQGTFPYGQRWSGTVAGPEISNVGFTGHEHDDDLGLINMKGRIYDPSQSRFLTPDPLVVPTVPGGMNPYSYALNSPANVSDPSGFQNVVNVPPQYIYADIAQQAAWDAQQQAMEEHQRQGTQHGDFAAQQAMQNAQQQAQLNQQRIAQEHALRGLGPTPALPGMTLEAALRMARRALVDMLVDKQQFERNRAAMQEQFGPPSSGVPYFSDAHDTLMRDAPEKALAVFDVYVAAAALTPAQQLVIGRGADLAKPGVVKPTERALGWPSKLPNMAAEWQTNAALLRSEMRRGMPIRDASPGNAGGYFLNMERRMLELGGWRFDGSTNFWMPPGR